MFAKRHVRSLALVLLAASCGGLSKNQMATSAPRYTIADRTSAESYHDWGKNPWVDASKDHLSTFAADVDTASYTIARRKLNEGALPPAAAVRVEEFVNYFRYAFPEPAKGSPFAVIMDAAPSPLVPGTDAATEHTFAMAAPPAASFEAAATDLQFAFAVSAFADLLRGQDDAKRWSLEAIE
jgi:von Willebrand factor